jgi:hypothetical protein
MVKIPPSKIFFWCEGDKLYFKSYINLVGKSPIVRMISNENSDLNAELNVPAEYIPSMINWIMTQLNIRKQMSGDLIREGVDKSQ